MRVERHARRGQRLQDRHRSRDPPGTVSCQRWWNARDQPGAMRKAPGERRHALVEPQPAIEIEVPGVKAHLGEKGVDRRLVGQELAVEQPRVPADQHVADVEDHRATHGPTLSRDGCNCPGRVASFGSGQGRERQHGEE